MDYKEFRNEFEKKVKSMNAHDIIMTMVDGLRYPRTEIDMDSFGHISNGVCFGCAATNAILQIMDAYADELGPHVCFIPRSVTSFERAVDELRRGKLELYNIHAERGGFSQITPMPDHRLPYLDNNYTEEQLQQYVKLAEYQLTV